MAGSGGRKRWYVDFRKSGFSGCYWFRSRLVFLIRQVQASAGCQEKSKKAWCRVASASERPVKPILTAPRIWMVAQRRRDRFSDAARQCRPAVRGRFSGGWPKSKVKGLKILRTTWRGQHSKDASGIITGRRTSAKFVRSILNKIH